MLASSSQLEPSGVCSRDEYVGLGVGYIVMNRRVEEFVQPRSREPRTF